MPTIKLKIGQSQTFLSDHNFLMGRMFLNPKNLCNISKIFELAIPVHN